MLRPRIRLGARLAAACLLAATALVGLGALATPALAGTSQFNGVNWADPNVN